MTLGRRTLGLLAAAMAFAAPALAHAGSPPADRWFTTTDGVKLHYVEAGPAGAPPILFVPGWTMPAWIFDRQVAGLSDRYRVFVLDPRGQGRSDIPATGYEPVRRGKDVGELVARIDRPVVIVGWSLGVLDTLSYLRASGDGRVAGLILVDNSIGEGPPPAPRGAGPVDRSSADRARARQAFVAGMFSRDPGEGYRTRLTADSLRMPVAAERALLSYPLPREAWRAAVHSTARPILYVVRPRFREQAEALVASRPNARMVVFETAGHALFVDEAERFNALVAGFMARDVQTARTQ